MKKIKNIPFCNLQSEICNLKSVVFVSLVIFVVQALLCILESFSGREAALSATFSANSSL